MTSGSKQADAPCFPLVPGPWLPLDADESRAFLDRLGEMLARSQGTAAFTRHMPVSGLRAMPLSFYPGWLIVEAEASPASGFVGTFDVLYGPRFMWVIDGDSHMIHDLNAGRISKLAGVAVEAGSVDVLADGVFLPSPLTALDEHSGPDYLRFFCPCLWREHGPFWPIESMDSALLESAAAEAEWRERARPMAMTRVDGALEARVLIGYGDALFDSTFRIERNGVVSMVSDELIARQALRPQRYHSPLRNLRPAPKPNDAGQP